MSGSTLNPPEESIPGTGKGHSTEALGPSDSSDSGSDVRGAVQRPGDIEGDLDRHALEEGELAFGSDTDRNGTGERASADGDGNLTLDGDITPDSVENIADIADPAADADPALRDDDVESDVDSNAASEAR